MRKKIPDLQYKVVRVRSVFCRAKYLLVFYRHDKDGAPFIDDVKTFVGENCAETRKRAFVRARAIVTGKEPRGWRELFISSDARSVVRALGVGMPTNG